MKLRLTVLTAVAVAIAASPSQAAVLVAFPNKPCYREGDPRDRVSFGGGPFTPNGYVNVMRDGIPILTAEGTPLRANAAGNISGLIPAPVIDPTKERPFTITATDAVNPALTGTLTRLVSQLDVTVRPAGGRPATRRRISARGFTGGGSLYAHVVRGRRMRTVRIGALRGPCGTLTARRRVFRRGTRNGTYRVQFDASPTYSRSTYPSLAFRVRIFTILRPRRSAASASERWVRIG